MYQGYSLCHRKPPPKFEIEALFGLVMLYTDTKKNHTSLTGIRLFGDVRLGHRHLVIVLQRGASGLGYTLPQALCDRHGPEHFRRKRNANMLANVVEYLLYTNRVNLCCCEG
ncbi:Uncharacterized protein FWK35_00011138 [Aphis craccivora]|uniref:Uncharacterized protein n=1 Tax=Aphis craccivora TaxID=307492 RepID=A0A6G0YPB2_APHCR|nr:Uncharacterized protein FWK35_00011138 [Aphis craccivora]